MKRKRRVLALYLAALLALCVGCKQNPPQEQLYSKLFQFFEARGYVCALTDEAVEGEVPIYKPSAWRVMSVGQERLLVYFDESNRADYLAEGCAASAGERVVSFGLRFVLCYRGADQGLLDALDECK